jgi:hypothetical protein
LEEDHTEEVKSDKQDKVLGENLQITQMIVKLQIRNMEQHLQIQKNHLLLLHREEFAIA